ncbi:MAG: hypothetical protein JRF40_02645 [Deltaproteobacteria bacterium]|nr:hypothetical protein [Deltaproteobacteria bacterium]
MTPIYFPYTFIPDTLLSAIFPVFGRIAVYQPSSSVIPSSSIIMEKIKKISEQDLIETRLPLKKYNGMVENVFKDYMNWADYHDKDQIRILKSHMDSIPFFNDSSSFNVKSEISKNSNKIKDQKFSPDFRAGLFLMHAQDLDIKHAEIDRGLKAVQNRTEDMLMELKGENATSNHENLMNDTDGPSFYMLKERLDAWTCLMFQDMPESCLFLTANKEVTNILFDDFHGAQKVLDYPKIPFFKGRENVLENWQREFKEYVCNLAVQTDPQSCNVPPEPSVVSDCEESFSFKLYAIYGETPARFFSRFSEQFSCGQPEKNNPSNCINTLIGLIVTSQ